MNLNEVLEREGFARKINGRQRLLDGVAAVLNQALHAMGVVIFWILMIALITSPAWVPMLVDGVIK